MLGITDSNDDDDDFNILSLFEKVRCGRILYAFNLTTTHICTSVSSDIPSVSKKTNYKITSSSRHKEFDILEMNAHWEYEMIRRTMIYRFFVYSIYSSEKDIGIGRHRQVHESCVV